MATEDTEPRMTGRGPRDRTRPMSVNYSAERVEELITVGLCLSHVGCVLVTLRPRIRSTRPVVRPPGLEVQDEDGPRENRRRPGTRRVVHLCSEEVQVKINF